MVYVDKVVEIRIIFHVNPRKFHLLKSAIPYFQLSTREGVCIEQGGITRLFELSCKEDLPVVEVQLV